VAFLGVNFDVVGVSGSRREQRQTEEQGTD
jgi:hypothetical protein